MSWNCPHCQASLILPEGQGAPRWSFASCYQCGGFALLKDSSASMLKVDRAPAGVQLLATCAPASRPAIIRSRRAQKRLERKEKEAIASLPQVQSQGNEVARAMETFGEILEEKKSKQKHWENIAPPPMRHPLTRSHSDGARFPEPLPELSEEKSSIRLLPIAMALTGLFAIVSGVYLVQETQTLWKKAKANFHQSSTLKPRASAPREEWKPLNLAEGPDANKPASKPNPVMVDQVHQAAMAPARPTPAKVQAKKPRSLLRAGPGTQFKTLGFADPQHEYEVAEWKEDWFKVVLPTPLPNGSRFAWIRNDLTDWVRPAPPKQ